MKRAASVLLALTALAYGVLLWAPFLYDDLGYIVGNPDVTGPWPGWRAAAGYALYGEGALLAHRLLYGLAGDAPLLYRLSSLLLHCAAALLAWRLFARLLEDERGAFWGALVFALLPCHVETLAVSAFKKHIAVGLCGLGLAWLQLGAPPLWLLCAGGWTLFGLAALAKESALVLPALAALLAWLRPESARSRKPYFAGLALLAAAAAAALLSVQRPLNAPLGGSWAVHLATVPKLALRSLGELAWPYSPSLEHAVSPASPAAGLAWLLAAAAALWALWRLARRDRTAAFGLAWCSIALLPFLNIVPMPDSHRNLTAGRYLYLAAAGWALYLARAARVRLPSRAAADALFAVLAAASLAAGVRAGALYSDPLALWSETARRAPGSARAQGALGAALRERGQAADAERHLRLALALEPGYEDPGLDLCALLMETGRAAEAVDTARLLTVREPGSWRAWRSLGAALMASGRPAEARPALERALSMDPDGGQAALALGFCELELGGLGRARRLFSAAAAGPWRARALFGLAQASLREKRREEAVDLLRSSLALDPWQADAAESLAAALAGAGRAAEARAVLDEVLARLAARRGALPTGSPAAARLGAMESRLRRNRPK